MLDKLVGLLGQRDRDRGGQRRGQGTPRARFQGASDSQGAGFLFLCRCLGRRALPARQAAGCEDTLPCGGLIPGHSGRIQARLRPRAGTGDAPDGI